MITICYLSSTHIVDIWISAIEYFPIVCVPDLGEEKLNEALCWN